MLKALTVFGVLLMPSVTPNNEGDTAVLGGPHPFLSAELRTSLNPAVVDPTRCPVRAFFIPQMRAVSTDQGSTQFATVDTDGNLIALHNDAPAPEGQFYPSLDGRGRTIEIGSARRLPSPLTDRPALGRTTQEPIGPHMITPAAARAPNTIGLAVIERTIKDSWVRARACTGVDTATVRR
ncbi:hypothetical protein A3L23_05097 (plasmid) [Rhodococcoides fascians D188]|nr:hypothetical protein A3L23_05097 [Rhodococcus fascians D188]